MAEYNIAVIIGSFHKDACQQMLTEVRNYCAENEIEISEEIWVAGSLEKPLALKKQLQKSDIDGAVLLGVIEKGESQHGLAMGQAVIKTVLELQLEFMKPVGLGIMGPGIIPEQIPPRIKPYAQDAVIALHQQLTSGDT